MTERIYTLQGVRNFRDFGGYASRHGGQVKRGRLFRSGHYAEATEEDLRALGALGIHLQADLRRPDERERNVARWSAPNTLTHDGGREHEAPHAQFLKKVEADAQKADDWMNDYYALAPFKAHHAELFSGWFEHLAGLEGDSAGLVNCAAGKDRTGILCALTHHVLGVEEADLRADYELTNTAVKVDEFLPQAAAFFNEQVGKAYEPEVFRPFLGVRLRYLDTAFNVIHDKHGTVDAYLADVLGVDEAAQERLRARLLEA